MPRFGIETTFVDTRDPAAFAASHRDNTRLVFRRNSSANPGLEVLNIPMVSKIAHDAALRCCDSTFTTPLPDEAAGFADLIPHSPQKFPHSGHGMVVGGLLVDGGLFDGRLGQVSPPTGLQ